MANPGEVDLTVTIDGQDASQSGLVVMGLNVYESAIDHHTYGDVLVFDSNDTLGQKNFSGKEKVEIKINNPGGGGQGATFKLAMLQNHDLKHTGALKAKTYQFRLISPEYLNAQGKVVNKSYKDQTSNIVKDVVENYWKSDKQINIKKQTKGEQKYHAHSRHPHDVINDLKDRHVSQNYEKDGSCFSLFEKRGSGGDQEIHFTTFEDMMNTKSKSSVEYTQSVLVGNETTKTGSDYSNILNLHIPSSFYTPYRRSAPTARSSYNLASGRQQKEEEQYKDPQLPISQTPISKSETQQTSGNKESLPQRTTYIDPSNEKNQTYIAQTKAPKAAWLARLTNDCGNMEVYFNPDLTVGEVIKIKIPNKSDKGGEEKQISQSVLITRLRTVYRPPGQKPGSTMIVEFIKAGFDEGVSG